MFIEFNECVVISGVDQVTTRGLGVSDAGHKRRIGTEVVVAQIVSQHTHVVILSDGTLEKGGYCFAELFGRNHKGKIVFEYEDVGVVSFACQF